MTSCRKWFLGIFLLFVLQTLCASALFAASEGSCVKCHANEAIIKSLHKPRPLPPAGSGEG